MSDAAPPTPAGPAAPFDQRACDYLRQAHALVLANVPEARGVASTVDYYGQLNDANVQKGVWTGAGGGEVATMDGALGALFQTIRLAEAQLLRAERLAHELRAEIQELSRRALELRRAGAEA